MVTVDWVSEEESATVDGRPRGCAYCKRYLRGCPDFDAFVEREVTQKDPNEADLIRLAARVACENFVTVFIEYPITVKGIVSETSVSKQERVGDAVLLFNGEEELEGVYLGMMPLTVVSTYSTETQVLHSGFSLNPFLYVPSEKRTYYGHEVMWRFKDGD